MQHGLHVQVLDKISETNHNAVTALSQGDLQLVINSTHQDVATVNDSRLIRNAAIENAVPLFTAFDTVKALLSVLESQAFTITPA